ncbi:beta-galactosidase GalA [Pelagicoccus albus]|uniref:Glycoside hydrolase family 2 protein n=1 Tax=Pelagicoccus albus TaxID=415222 RepID=A0A7X1B5R6_9BACT|nr:beta-galactosidase GalA [Pelagicoccus albus]MBC2606149.1 glycoside hydrolase family 2 protein [Pelagicoccus albus]
MLLKKLPLLAALFAATAAFSSSSQASERTRDQINDGWKFALGHATDKQKDFGHGLGYFSYLAKTGFGDGAASPSFDDRAWREISIPHDWAVEAEFSPDASYSHGFKAIGPGFPESSVGWYRRELDISEDDLGKRIRIEFDGIYRDAAVFVNGFFVGQEPSGFVSQSYDITEYLNYGGKNVVAVRADAYMEEGWYYEGAGIYRHAYLLKTAPVHVARYGTYVTTEVEKNKAAVSVETKVANDSDSAATVSVFQSILDNKGKEVAKAESLSIEVGAGKSGVVSQDLMLKKPKLWDLDSPNLYTMLTQVKDSEGELIDEYRTSFGVRTIRFDPNEGFFLNGRSVKLKGSNNHQDHAGVGAAMSDAMQDFRIKALKDMGSNAYRVSHHHASPALLESCDRLGMLVIDETRLMGINEYHFDQLEHLILRDRNHPSVIVWSVGNEEWGIEGNIFGARIAKRMQDFVHRLDPTRVVTAAVSGGWGGISSTIEAFGVNYIKHGDVDQQHEDYPDQIIIGTEETTTQQTRGIYFEDAALAHQHPKENGSSGGNAELGWKFYDERDYTAGVFFWTGFDYRGEPTPYEWPAVLSQFGILDNCGFPKDGYYYLKSWWSDEPVLHIFPHWNWPGKEGETIEVRAHSNYEEVELFVNGESQGRKEMPHNGHLAWDVEYAPGELLAKGYTDGKVVAEKRVRTTGESAAFALEPDRSEIKANGQDISVITLSVLDERGDVVPTADDLAFFTIEGPGEIIGVGNGNPSSLEPDQYNESVEKIKVGEWVGPKASITDQPVVFETTFDSPELEKGQSARMLLNPVGKDLKLTLNGKLLDNALFDEAVPVESLDLKASGNVLKMEAMPFDEWGAREDVQTLSPLAFAITTPAEQYKRKAFNGLAQIIVQSTGEAGEIVLKAEGEGLEAVSLIISAH